MRASPPPPPSLARSAPPPLEGPRPGRARSVLDSYRSRPDALRPARGGAMRAIKNLFVLVIVLGALGAGAVAALRFARAKPSGAERIKPDLVGVSAAGMYVYAARIGTHVVVFDTGADPEGHPVDAAV